MKHFNTLLCTTVWLFSNYTQAVVLKFGIRGRVQADLDIPKSLKNEITSPFNWLDKSYVTPDITSFDECHKIDTDNLEFDTTFPPIISTVTADIYPEDSKDPIGSQSFWAVAMYNAEDCTPINDQDYPLQVVYERTWQIKIVERTFFLRSRRTWTVAENGEKNSERQANLRDSYRSFKLIMKEEFNSSKGKAVQVYWDQGEVVATAPAEHVFRIYDENFEQDE